MELFWKKVVENIIAHFYVAKFFFKNSSRILKNEEKYCRAGRVTCENIICRTAFPCWIDMFTDNNSEYLIITTFPLQQRFQGCAPNFRDTCIACLVLLLHVYM
jgi:hypothetical protein